MLRIAFLALFLLLAPAAYAEDAVVKPADATVQSADATFQSADAVRLDLPGLTDQQLADWAMKAAREVMTFGHADYQQKLEAAQKNYFTQDGWKAFMEALDAARMLEAVTHEKQSVTATTGAATVVEKSVVGGRHRWVVEMPYALDFSGMTQDMTALRLRLVITRADKGTSPMGVGITQWLVFI